MRGKNIIVVVYYLLKYVLYLNIILAGSIIGFQITNFISGNKMLSANYLGKFVFQIKSAGVVEGSSGNWVNVFLEQFTGQPSLIIDKIWHPWFILGFTLTISAISLFYNYQLYRLFNALYRAIKSGSPFNNAVSESLKAISLFSMLVFVCGMLLTILKLILLNNIVIENFVAQPAFDNGILNFLWVAIGTFVLNEIYKVGLNLKEEQDFTV